MQPVGETDTSKPKDIDTRSLISMQELEPSPVDDFSDLENGDHIPKTQSFRPTSECVSDGGFFISKLGLRGHRWDSWCRFKTSMCLFYCSLSAL